jgi:hypothetical protein
MEATILCEKKFKTLLYPNPLVNPCYIHIGLTFLNFSVLNKNEDCRFWSLQMIKIMQMQISDVAVLTIYIYYIYTVHTTFCIHIDIGKGTTSTAAANANCSQSRCTMQQSPNKTKSFTALCSRGEQRSHRTQVLTYSQPTTPYATGTSHGTTQPSAPGWRMAQSQTC